ncbi:MAG: AI-2E family transporter [Methanomicrobiales archaeon]|nr:AI-2E family transporter [Methanomicrobiales archaeon]
MTPPPSLSEPARIVVVLAAIVIVLAGMKAATPILGPIIFSVFLAVIFGMLLHWFEKRGLSPRSALMLTLVIFFAIVAVFVVVIVGSFFQLLAELPGYQEELEGSVEMAGPLFSVIGIDPASLSFSDLIGSLTADVGGLLSGLWDLVTACLLILLTTLFLIFEAMGFSSKLRKIIGELRPGDIDRFTTLAQKNVDYLIIRTEINLIVGIATTVILVLAGVDFAIFWGFLAFLMGFIPYIGFWLALIPPVLIAWFSLGPVTALLILAGVSIVNLLAEYVMFPHLAGRGLALSPAVVFISLVFWGWILGGVGVLLAVPLTLAVQMACELFDETRWIGVLLGPSPGPEGGEGEK